MRDNGKINQVNYDFLNKIASDFSIIQMEENIQLKISIAIIYIAFICKYHLSVIFYLIFYEVF
jgi:hypothetical protein